MNNDIESTEKRKSPLIAGTYKLNKEGSDRPPTTTGDTLLKRRFKSTLAGLTVSASIIGACSTISGFAKTVAPGVALSSPQLAGPPGPISVSGGQSAPVVDADLTTQYKNAQLLALNSRGGVIAQCPLTNTKFNAKLSGYVARVNVTQVFKNSSKDVIDAVYNFPLSTDSAVDDMTITIGDRTIKGEIKTKEAAKQIYENARATGHVAALLDQQRTNIFTQHVANIQPGKEVVVKISYVELLKFEDNKFTFSLPTTIGPRFMPESVVVTPTRYATNALPPKLPGNLPAQMISGQALSIDVDVDAGMPIKNISSASFPIMVDRADANHSRIALRNSINYPNQDFVLSYDLDGTALKSGYLTTRNGDVKTNDGYATFMLMPPNRNTNESIAPKEMIFLVDCSGSQDGPPLQKAKETMNYIVDHMNGNDTFQVLAFNDQVSKLSEYPVHAGPIERSQAHNFINNLRAVGGTWMGPAVEQVLHQPPKKLDDLKRLRIVTFMTDGFVGNDTEILEQVRKERGQSRWFTFGTGSSVNRNLIDNVARLGGGEPDYVLLSSSAEEAGKKFYSRIANPVLTDVNLKAEGIELYDVQPGAVADVWANKPLYFTARYKRAGSGKVTLSGYAGGKPYTQTLDVTLPENDRSNAVLEQIWTRQKIAALIDQDLQGLAEDRVREEVKSEVTKLALEHRLMSDFTSFVAVDSATTSNSPSRLVEIPNALPEGVNPVTTIEAPLLQGATSGTISPQYYGGTIINGVNTAGSVRVNNLANVEAVLNLIAGGLQMLGFLWGVPTIVLGFLGLAKRKTGASKKILFGISGLGLGIAMPGIINWLVALARDASFFN